MGGADPVDRAADLPPVGGIAAAGRRVVMAVDFDHVSVFVFNARVARDEIRVAQTDLAAGGKAEVFLRGVFHEVVPFDVENPREGDLTNAVVGIFGIVHRVEEFGFPLGVVVDDQFERTEHPHAAQRLLGRTRSAAGDRPRADRGTSRRGAGGVQIRGCRSNG